MKTLILLLSLLIYSEVIMGQKSLNMKERLEFVPATTLPFVCEKKCPQPQPIMAVVKEYFGNLPIYTYEDLGATIKTSFKNEDCSIFRRLQPTNGNYYLAVLGIGITDWQKRILVTYNSQNAKIIDFIECEIYFAGEEWLYTKQWKVDENMQVVVYAINLISPEKVMFGTEFPPIQAQRVDTYYQISPERKFSRTKEVKYKPQTYTKAYLEDRTKNFWNGTETVED